MLIVLGWLCYAIPAAGQDAQYGATARAPRESFDSVRSAQTIDARTADRAAPGNVGDMLEEADGVVVQRTSSASASPIIRGLTGNRVLVVLDDLRLNDPLTRAGGHALLNLIDPESVAQVEVVRGPASVVYGSDALGGVVRVVSQRPDATPDSEPNADTSLYVRAASAERHGRAQGSLGAVAGPLGVRLSLGRGHAGRLLRGGGLGVQPFTGHDDWTLAGTVEVAPRRNHRLWLTQQSGHLFNVPRTDVSTPEDLRTTRNLDRDSVLANYQGRWPRRRLRLHAFSGLVLRGEVRNRLRGDRVEVERDKVLSYQLGASLSLNPWGTASLKLGVSGVLDRVRSDTLSQAAATEEQVRSRGRYVDGSKYDTAAMYGLLSQPLHDDLVGLLGVRATYVGVYAPSDPIFDQVEGVDGALRRRLFGTVASLGLRYDATESLSLMGSLLGGFRAPNLEDFQALGGGARGFSIPNPGLDEERSQTLEFGVKLGTQPLQLETFLWGSWLTGLIVRVPAALDGATSIDGDPVVRRANASRSLLAGIETGLTRRFESGLYAGFSASATYGETRRPDATGGNVREPADKIPPPRGLLRLGFQKAGRALSAEARLSGQLAQTRLSESDRQDVRLCERGSDTCDAVDGYVDFSLRASLAVGQHLTILLSLENLLDAGYKTYASGAYAPGRNFVLAIRGTSAPPSP